RSSPSGTFALCHVPTIRPAVISCPPRAKVAQYLSTDQSLKFQIMTEKQIVKIDNALAVSYSISSSLSSLPSSTVTTPDETPTASKTPSCATPTASAST